MSTTLLLPTLPEGDRRDRAWADRQPGESVPQWRHRTRSFPVRAEFFPGCEPRDAAAHAGRRILFTLAPMGSRCCYPQRCGHWEP